MHPPHSTNDPAVAQKQVPLGTTPKVAWMAAATLLEGLLLSLLLPVSPALAGSGNAPLHASKAVDFSILIPSVFRVTRSRAVAGGREVVVWTNMPAVRISDREYRFDRVGEATLFVPDTTGGAAIVHGL